MKSLMGFQAGDKVRFRADYIARRLQECDVVVRVSGNDLIAGGWSIRMPHLKLERACRKCRRYSGSDGECYDFQ